MFGPLWDRDFADTYVFRGHIFFLQNPLKWVEENMAKSVLLIRQMIISVVIGTVKVT